MSRDNRRRGQRRRHSDDPLTRTLARAALAGVVRAVVSWLLEHLDHLVP